MEASHFNNSNQYENLMPYTSSQLTLVQEGVMQSSQGGDLSPELWLGDSKKIGPEM